MGSLQQRVPHSLDLRSGILLVLHQSKFPVSGPDGTLSSPLLREPLDNDEAHLSLTVGIERTRE